MRTRNPRGVKRWTRIKGNRCRFWRLFIGLCHVEGSPGLCLFSLREAGSRIFASLFTCTSQPFRWMWMRFRWMWMRFGDLCFGNIMCPHLVVVNFGKMRRKNLLGIVASLKDADFGSRACTHERVFRNATSSSSFQGGGIGVVLLINTRRTNALMKSFFFCDRGGSKEWTSTELIVTIDSSFSSSWIQDQLVGSHICASFLQGGCVLERGGSRNLLFRKLVFSIEHQQRTKELRW